MIFSAIAGWFVRRFWPTGIIIVLLISAANAAIQYVRYEEINSTRKLFRERTYSNDLSALIGGLAIDVVINLVVFAIVWRARRKFKPHVEPE